MRPTSTNLIMILLSASGVAGCGLFDSKDHFKVESDPDYQCLNSTNSEWRYLGIPEEYILSMAINPINARHMLVGTSANYSDGKQGKIYMSLDCGESWEQVWEGGYILGIRFNPKSPNIVYANPYGMIRSTDWGRSWTRIDKGLTEHLSFTSQITSFAVDPVRPQRLYAGTQDLGAGRLFYTDDSGRNWRLIPAHRSEGPGAGIAKNAVAFIEIDPYNPAHVYVGVGPVMRSKDRGSTWEMIRNQDNSVLQTVAFSSDYSKFYAMNTYGGFYTYHLPDGLWEFSPYPDSLVGTWVHGISDSPMQDGVLLGTGRGVLLKSGGDYISMNMNLPYSSTTMMRTSGVNLYVGVHPQRSHTSHMSGVYVLKLN